MRNGAELTLRKEGAIHGRYKCGAEHGAVYVLLTVEEYEEFEKYLLFADAVALRTRGDEVE